MRKKILRDIQASLFGRKDFMPNNINNSWAYPINFEFTLDNEDFYFEPKDEYGIPLTPYNFGHQYNPTRIAGYGLANWNKYLISNEEIYLIKFKKVADWFLKNHSNGLWHYQFNFNGLKKPWISCMAQGQAISILVRNFIILQDKHILSIANNAVEPFNVLCGDGGLKSILNSGDIFWEEFPNNNPTHVLNGYLFAVIGLIELNKVIPSQNLTNLLDISKRTLENNLELWNLKYWSAYDLDNLSGLRNPCTTSYHSLHVSQLIFIGKELQSEKIIEIAKLWEEYLNNPLYRIRALIGKIIYRFKNG